MIPQSSSLLSLKIPQGPIIEGNNVVLTCEITGGNPLPTITWDCDGSSPTSTTTPPPTDTATSSVTITVSANDNGKTCRCIGNHILWTDSKITSHNLTVHYGPTTTNLTPTTTSYTVTEKGYLDPITCSADCNPACTITWAGPHIPVPTISTLNLQNIDRNHAGNYSCNANNSIGNQTVKVQVLVYYGPEIVDISPDTTSYVVTENTGIGQVTCSADCRPNCMVTWTGPSLPPGITSILNLQNIIRKQAGDYHCIAKNNIGSWKSVTVHITVNYAPDTFPTVQQTPEGVIIPGSTVTLTCSVSGGYPLAVLSWDCNGINRNRTSGNTASYSVEFTAETTYNNRICNCSATHFIVSYRPVIQHKLSIHCTENCLENKDVKGLFAASISSLAIGILSLLLGIFLNARWFFRLKEKKTKRHESYTEFNTIRSTETANTYDSVNQTTNVGTNRDNSERIDSRLSTKPQGAK